MIHRPARRFLSWVPILAVVASVGCAEQIPQPPIAALPAAPATVPDEPGPWPFLADTRIAPPPVSLVRRPDLGRPASALPVAEPRWSGASSSVNALVAPLTGARFDMARGQAILDAIDALPAERRALGVRGLTTAQLYGADLEGGLCEQPRVLVDVADDSGTWELALTVDAAVWLGPPARDRGPLDQVCVDALAEAGGDLAAAVGSGCTEDDETTFFLDGSACRTCLEVDGDFGRCVGEALCSETATRRLFAYDGRNQRQLYTRLVAPTLMCAPDLETTAVLLVPDLEEEDPLPPVFVNGPYDAFCTEQWDEASDGISMFCSLSTAGGHALLDVLPARVDRIVRPGQSGDGHARRLAVPRSVSFEDGRSYTFAMGYERTIGTVSDAPEDGGWGFDPYELRPGGTDPDDPDDTYARHWLGAVTTKLATTRDGVPVWPFDHNRCLAWGPPEADGSSTCAEMGGWTGSPHDDGWIDFWTTVPFDHTCEGCGLYVFPFATLVSTGLPDPKIPGGVVIHAMGSSTLESFDGTGCPWPETFEPDRHTLYDSLPVQTDVPYATFDGQTWRFDRGPHDIRVGLMTNHARGFCPGPAPR